MSLFLYYDDDDYYTDDGTVCEYLILELRRRENGIHSPFSLSLRPPTIVSRSFLLFSVFLPPPPPHCFPTASPLPLQATDASKALRKSN